MNVLLIPMMLMTTLTQIQVSPELIVQGTAIKHNNEDYVGLPGDKWTLMSQLTMTAKTLSMMQCISVSISLRVVMKHATTFPSIKRI